MLNTAVPNSVQKSAPLFELVKIGDLVFDRDRKRVLVDGKSARLSPLEFEILDLLAHRTTPTKRQEVHSILYGGHVQKPTLTIIDVFMFRIRDKLAEVSPDKKGRSDFIESIYGKGYMLRRPPKQESEPVST